MSEINYESVNIDAKVLEEQNENLKKPKESLQNAKKIKKLYLQHLLTGKDFVFMTD